MHQRSRSRPSKSIACRRCHARKVKCSGGTPCGGCRQANRESECVYPLKARLVKVSEKYIEDLVGESAASCATIPSKGPTLADAPWFINTGGLRTPILVAEASDAAFATRFRQAMSDAHHGHIPRVDFPTDEQLLTLSENECPWPSPAHARLLVNAALNGLGRCYYMVRRSSILTDLECAIQNHASLGSLNKTKLWAIFAVGEMYATRSSAVDKGFPGVHYFAKAMHILRLVSERPSLDMVEIWLLLSIYSLSLNRRHSAYNLAGSAVRLATIMGLHLNVPESQMSDVGEREHRIRIWWTVYILDRMWAAKLGYPAAIQDDEIDVNLPSSPVGLVGSAASDFPDLEYFLAKIGLARLSARMIHSIYGKKSQKTSLPLRVQDAFGDLRRWLESLPPSLRIDARGKAEMDPKARSLHLLFNQLAVLATRPILLHVLRTHLEARGRPSNTDVKVPASAAALSETCLRCARHSCRMLLESWTNGSFMIFDYFYTQYLFSAATILAISSLLDSPERQTDEEQFELAVHFLSQLRDNGNYAAAEFYKHIEAMMKLMQTRGSNAAATELTSSADATSNDAVGWPSTVHEPMTAGTALSDPLLQELLDQPLPDLEFIDSSMYLDDQQGFYWPGL
ncbi:hypothetical protein BDV12DRAFT_189773 [Aspergillus spectabilis]